MQSERYGTCLSTGSAGAVERIESATRRILAHQPDVDLDLTGALAQDPGCVAAHALRGLCQVTLARAETMWRARGHLARAKAGLRRTAPTGDEIALVQVLEVAVQGGLRAGADMLEARLAERPRLVLFAKLAQALRFMAGDVAGLATGVDRTLAHLDPDAPGYGFLLGCRAFASEEVGDFAQAERLGRRAVALEPADAWGMHAVGHVFEMTVRPREGLAWIESRRPAWRSCNNFALHMGWHAALFHIELRDHAAALDLFDRDVWPRASADFRDLSNAVSLLKRLEGFGVDVGDRWDGLAAIASAQRHDDTYVFAGLHNLLALLACGRHEDAADLLACFDRPARPGNDQGEVRRDVGAALARVIFAAATTGSADFDAARLTEAMPMLGGSAAQRDVFLRCLAEAAVGQRDDAAVEAVLAARRQLRAADRFETVVRRRLATRSTRLRHIA